MTDEIALSMWVGLVLGYLIGYVIWAPDTRFKRNFVDGLTLKFLWGKR